MPIIDDMRRAFGIRTMEDRDAVARGHEAMERDHTPAGRLARDIAYAAVPREGEAGRRPLPDGLVKVMLPELAHDPRPLPRDPEVRRLQIAEAASRMIDRHVQYGSDQRLGPELGRAVREDAVRRTGASDVIAVPMDGVLDGRSQKGGRKVAAYLAHGQKVEEHHRRLVRSLPERGAVPDTVARLASIREMHPERAPASGPALGAWVDAGLRTERAMARAGLLTPDRIVAAASQTMRNTPEAVVGTLAAEPRARPDFDAARRLDPSARREAVQGWMTTSERPTPNAAAREAPTVRERAPGPAMNPAIAAGLAARGRSM